MFKFLLFVFFCASYLNGLEIDKKESCSIFEMCGIVRIVSDLWLEKLDSSLGFLQTQDFIVAKIIISLIAFVVLWLFRKIFAKFVVFCVDIFTHIAQKDETFKIQLQKDVLKPIIFFLTFVSFHFMIELLYFPSFTPKTIENIISIVYVINLTWFIIVVLRGYGLFLLSALAQKQKVTIFKKEVINLILKIIYFFIGVVALLICLKILGFNVSAIIASLGLGGLAVALAVKDMLANFFASIMLLFDNSFSQGDDIECSGVRGRVVEMGLRRTTIRAADNSLILIPNAELANNAITNWSRRKSGRLINMSVGVNYGASVEQLKSCVRDIKEMLESNPNVAHIDDVKEMDYILSLKQEMINIDDMLGYKNAVYVAVENLADSSINILVYCFSKNINLAQNLALKEEIIFSIMDIVKNNGLDFAFPSQSVYVENLPSLELVRKRIEND